MTTRRQDTGTSLRRGFARPSAVRLSAPAPADEPTPETTPAPAPARPPKEKPVTTKYTALLTLDDAERFDQLATHARRRAGRVIGKADLMRALILLAADDAALRDQVIDQAATLADEAREARGR